MGMTYKEIGGGAASGLGNDWANFLAQGLKTGTFGGASAASQYMGANPIGSTQGIAGVLNDILAGGGGNVGGGLASILQTQQNNDINSLRARYGAEGGTAFGTPAAYAESTYRAQAAPQIATQVGQLQLSALSQLFPQIGALAQKGIPQAEVVAQQNPLVSTIGSIAPAVGAFLGGPGGAALFGGGGSPTQTGVSPSYAVPASFTAPPNFNIAPPTLTGFNFNSPFAIPSIAGVS